MLRAKIIVLAIALIAMNVPSPLAPKAQAAVSSWQKGASIQPRTSTDFMGTEFKESLFQLANTGANFVTLIIPFWSPSGTSSQIVPALNTPTDEALIAAINHAHMLGLKVNLKFHPEAQGVAWRARITPTDRQAWFQNYATHLNRYGEIGRLHGVEMMTIGTELINMTLDRVHIGNTAAWRKIIADLRQIYPGLITYCANWRESATTGELDHILFWDDLDFISISGYYPPTSTKNGYTSQSLVSRWDQWNNSSVKPVWQKYNKPVIFGEVGYRSLDGGLVAPADWRATGPVDEQEQADGYQALFQYWNTQSFMQGIHIWDWHPTDNAGGPTDTDFTPQNKKAQGVITSWFKTGAGPSPTPTPTPTPTPLPPPPPGSPQDIVIHVGTSANQITGNWQKASDSTAASGTRMHNPNRSRPKLDTALSNPTNYFEVTFNAEANRPYHIWMRAKADGNSPQNDSVHVQFTSSLNSSGQNDFRIGTTKSLSLVLEEGDGAAVSGWGWNDNHYGSLGESISFSSQGTQTMRIQERQDGISIDQIILSPSRFLSTRPGLTKNDKTIYPLNPTPPPVPSPTPTPTPTPNPPPPAPNPNPPPPPPIAARIDVWWPVNNASVSGVFPLKAVVPERMISEYDMYWQVDNGQLNLMNDSMQDWPHKESWIDVSGWNWQPSKAYKITFVARSKVSNATIAQQDVTIIVNQ